MAGWNVAAAGHHRLPNDCVGFAALQRGAAPHRTAAEFLPGGTEANGAEQAVGLCDCGGTERPRSSAGTAREEAGRASGGGARRGRQRGGGNASAIRRVGQDAAGAAAVSGRPAVPGRSAEKAVRRDGQHASAANGRGRESGGCGGRSDGRVEGSAGGGRPGAGGGRYGFVEGRDARMEKRRQSVARSGERRFFSGGWVSV